MNQRLIDALDLIIEKYSKDTFQGGGVGDCPFCRNIVIGCGECPNKNEFYRDCVGRGYAYPQLDYMLLENYPTLKKFWSDYKELYLQGKNNEEIMEILLEHFIRED